MSKSIISQELSKEIEDNKIYNIDLTAREIRSLGEKRYFKQRIKKVTFTLILAFIIVLGYLTFISIKYPIKYEIKTDTNGKTIEQRVGEKTPTELTFLLWLSGSIILYYPLSQSFYFGPKAGKEFLEIAKKSSLNSAK